MSVTALPFVTPAVKTAVWHAIICCECSTFVGDLDERRRPGVGIVVDKRVAGILDDREAFSRRVESLKVLARNVAGLLERNASATARHQ